MNLKIAIFFSFFLIHLTVDPFLGNAQPEKPKIPPKTPRIPAASFSYDAYRLDKLSMKFRYHNEAKPIPLGLLPKDRYGYPDWAEAVRMGIVNPNSNIPGEGEIIEEIIDLLVPIKSKMSFMPNVLFPHSIHTYWLPCNVCHPKIFLKKRGGNNEMTMVKIINGEYCGRCHNKVAFPIQECYRCHIRKRYKNRGVLTNALKSNIKSGEL